MKVACVSGLETFLRPCKNGILKQGMDHLTDESQSGTLITAASADTAVFESRSLPDTLPVQTGDSKDMTCPNLI